jgi:ABC-type Na+ transport system ATPase subunit NatA
MISMLTALLEPTGGKVIVDGLNLDTHTREVKAKLGMVLGFVLLALGAVSFPSSAQRGSWARCRD